MNAISPARANAVSHPMTDKDQAPMDPRRKHEAATYIASLLAGLRQIADGAELDKLVSALDNAFYEAFTLTNTGQSKPQAAASAEQPKVAEHS